MEFSISFSNRHALVLKEKTLNKLSALLCESYPNTDMSISAVLNNQYVAKFKDIEELLAYDNSGDYRIKKLTIDLDSSHKCEIKFYPSNALFLEYETASVSFRMKSKDESVAFRAKLEEIFREMKQPFYYTILSNIPVPIVIILAYTLWNSKQVGSAGDLLSVPLLTLILALLIVLFIIILLLKIYIVWRNFFPSIRFLWGDEVTRLEKSIMNNIFWSIIVPIIIGVISRYI